MHQLVSAQQVPEAALLVEEPEAAASEQAECQARFLEPEVQEAAASNDPSR